MVKSKNRYSFLVIGVLAWRQAKVTKPMFDGGVNLNAVSGEILWLLRWKKKGTLLLTNVNCKFSRNWNHVKKYTRGRIEFVFGGGGNRKINGFLETFRDPCEVSKNKKKKNRQRGTKPLMMCLRKSLIFDPGTLQSNFSICASSVKNKRKLIVFFSR